MKNQRFFIISALVIFSQTNLVYGTSNYNTEESSESFFQGLLLFPSLAKHTENDYKKQPIDTNPNLDIFLNSTYSANQNSQDSMEFFDSLDCRQDFNNKLLITQKAQTTRQIK